MSRGGNRHYPDPLTVVTVVAIAAFTLFGIGGPLVGQGVFAGTDELMELAPYQGEGLNRTPVQNYYVDDTWDSGIPNTLLLTDAVRSGELPAWNPYTVAGSPLGAVPITAALSPATVPFYLLPGYLAPGYVKLIEILLAVTGCALFLRRLGLRHPAALVGGLAFASSGFLIAWTNWPHTRVTVIVPFVFWALERLVVQRRIRDGALVSLAVAAMLLGGFPAVAGYALLLGGVYLLVRAIAEHWRHWRRAAGVLLGGGAGVLGGAALSAVQIVPFASFLGAAYLSGRGQTPEDHLALASLITTIAPWALGGIAADPPVRWYLTENMIESLSYVGAGALVLAVTAIAAPRAARAVLPRGVWAFLVVATFTVGWVCYGGGEPLDALQELPGLFSDNFVGRIRSVLGFLVAALAAVGLEVLMRRERTHGRARWLRVGFGALVWGALTALGIWIWQEARSAAMAADERARERAEQLAYRNAESGDGVDRLAHLNAEATTGLVLLLVGLVCAGVLGWTTPHTRGERLVRTTAAALLPVLITVQALTLVRQIWPRADRDTFYPITGTHAFLAGHLGHERFAGTWHAMGVGADTHLRLRALTGHTFVDARLGELVRQVPGTGGLYPTLVNFGVSPEIVGSPVLDRLSTRYFVTTPQGWVLGIPRPAHPDDTIAVLRPDEPVTLPVPDTGPLRAVGLTPLPPLTETAEAKPNRIRLEVMLHRANGSEVARNERREPEGTLEVPFLVPVAAEQVAPDEPLIATFTLRAAEPLVVHAIDGVPAITTVGGAADGLRVAYAGSAVIYQRLSALPRIRWASDSVVEPDQSRRLDRLSAGNLTADQVLLDAPGPGADGAAAQLRVVTDGLDEIVVDVAAGGAGYLVVADALQTGWAVTVDGAPADLVPADHAVVAVAVPAGEHRVRLHYAGPQYGAGTVITSVAVLALLGLVGAEWRAARRRRRG